MMNDVRALCSISDPNLVQLIGAYHAPEKGQVILSSIKPLTHLVHVMAMLCLATENRSVAPNARLTAARWSAIAAVCTSRCCCLPCPQAWAIAIL